MSRVLEWLEEIGNDRLFLFVHYYDTHSDYASLPEFEKLACLVRRGVRAGQDRRNMAAAEGEYTAYSLGLEYLGNAIATTNGSGLRCRGSPTRSSLG